VEETFHAIAQNTQTSRTDLTERLARHVSSAGQYRWVYGENYVRIKILQLRRMKKLPQIKPLTLTRLRKPFDHPEWIFELKHDGFRGVAYIEAANCKLISRNATVFRRFPQLCESLSKLAVRNAILDGEIICLDGDGISVFDQLMFRRGVPYYYVFDLMWLNGKDLRARPLLDRKKRLKKLVMQAANPALLYADHVDQFGVDFFQMICDKDLEGIMAKHRASPYSPAAKWIKIKNPAYTQAERRHELFERA
jgi:bifunctional non-homologous end joining protein LigD